MLPWSATIVPTLELPDDAQLGDIYQVSGKVTVVRLAQRLQGEVELTIELDLKIKNP